MQTERTKRFLQELIQLYHKHSLTLSHEDEHGLFIVEEFDNRDICWLQNAKDKTQPGKTVKLRDPTVFVVLWENEPQLAVLSDLPEAIFRQYLRACEEHMKLVHEDEYDYGDVRKQLDKLGFRTIDVVEVQN
jgi:hypothetical protein